MFDIDRHRALRAKLLAREQVFGGWMSFGHASIAEIFAQTKCFDFVALDMEHSNITIDEAQNLIRAVNGAGSVCLPRPGSSLLDICKPLLESGAGGLICPMINSPREFSEYISPSLFPPSGVRSYGVNRAHGYGRYFDEYVNSWNDSAIFVAQIESSVALDNIEKICDQESLCGVMVGPYDLTASLGITGDFANPAYLRACEAVARAAADKGKTAMIQVADCSIDNIAVFEAVGFNAFVMSSDLFILNQFSESVDSMYL